MKHLLALAHAFAVSLIASSAIAQTGIASHTSVGVFTTTQYNYFGSFLLNGINPTTEYQNQQGGYNATDALTVGINVPSTTTIHGTNGLAAYIVSNRGTYDANGGDVAGYFQARAAANNSNVFGINALTSDTAAYSRQSLQNELDFNVSGANTLVTAMTAYLNANTAPSYASAFDCGSAGRHPWTVCYRTLDGAVMTGAEYGTVAPGNRVGSVPIQFDSRAAGGAAYSATIRGDAGGGLDLRSGSSTGAIGFQNALGANYAYIDPAGLTILPTTQSTSTTTGAIVDPGGLGVAKNATVGGTVSAAGVTSAATLASTTQIYPGTGSATQTGGGFLAGTGNPRAGVGNNGDFYFRTDCTHGASDCTWHKESGTWFDLN